MPPILYPRQRQILDFLRQFIEKYEYAPTLREIAEALNVGSLATVHEHIHTMIKKGVIRKTPGVRGVEIVESANGGPSQGVELPVLGFVAAGYPLEPHTDPNAKLNISCNMLSGKKRAFILQVKGSSMIDEGILDGDYVVVEQQEKVNNGDIVVAILENGFATLKRFFKETTRIRLEPANSEMAPIFAKNVRIQGKVVGVVRKY